MMKEGQKPLFPQPIPIIGCTGEYASGKTLFGLTIDPKRTLVYDLEKSSESYLSLGFDRIDVPKELNSLYPNGYKPKQTFEWWRDRALSLRADKYSVVVLDPASEIEEGLCDWVNANPGHFGHTATQYVKMKGIFWADVRQLWKSLLTDLSCRCEVFVFTVHMKAVWENERPVAGKRVHKGKSTLMELASLFLQMERKPDIKGNVPVKPSAIVLKSRLLSPGVTIGEDGELTQGPLLPPRLPVATPAAIRRYMEKPADYSRLSQEERVPEQGLSNDERAAIRLATVEAERDAEQLRLELLQRQQEAETRAQAPKRTTSSAPAKKEGDRAVVDAAMVTVEAAKSGTPPPSSSLPQTASFSAHAVGEEQLLRVAELRKEWFAGPLLHASDETRKEAWLKILAEWKVNTARALTRDQADLLIAILRTKLDLQAMQDGMQDGLRSPDSEKGEMADGTAEGG